MMSVSARQKLTTAPTLTEAFPPLLAPALHRLLRATPVEVLGILDDTPHFLWPKIAEFVASRSTFDPDVVATVIRVTGRPALTAALGRYSATALWRRVQAN